MKSVLRGAFQDLPHGLSYRTCTHAPNLNIDFAVYHAGFRWLFRVLHGRKCDACADLIERHNSLDSIHSTRNREANTPTLLIRDGAVTFRHRLDFPGIFTEKSTFAQNLILSILRRITTRTCSHVSRSFC